MRSAGATLVAGQSAHVFHGAEPGVLYDLGDFLDDYAVNSRLRNDLGLLFFVTLDRADRCGSRQFRSSSTSATRGWPTGDDADWIRRRFREAVPALGTEVAEEDGRLVVSL